jgi:acetoin utilization deacetylase AcuC-like enzyme
MTTRGAIPVYYSPLMIADSGSFSPSAAKPGPVVSSWQQLGVPIDVIAPTPVTQEQLALSHDPQFVREILCGERKNGFGNCSMEVARSLPYTSGSLLSAARAALENGVAVSPSSGFHHAGYDRALGFCTFNGLMVTAAVLHKERRVRRVGILDFDMHYGNGSDEIIERLGIDWVTHFTAGKDYDSPAQAREFLSSVDAIVQTMQDCELILYQAGADPHIQDPLGGWLTTEQLHERDQRVFAAVHKLGIPIAWNLAGGYQQPLRRVLDIHDNTMRACAAEYRR